MANVARSLIELGNEKDEANEICSAKYVNRSPAMTTRLPDSCQVRASSKQIFPSDLPSEPLSFHQSPSSSVTPESEQYTLE